MRVFHNGRWKPAEPARGYPSPGGFEPGRTHVRSGRGKRLPIREIDSDPRAGDRRAEDAARARILGAPVDRDASPVAIDTWEAATSLGSVWARGTDRVAVIRVARSGRISLRLSRIGARPDFRVVDSPKEAVDFLRKSGFSPVVVGRQATAGIHLGGSPQAALTPSRKSTGYPYWFLLQGFLLPARRDIREITQANSRQGDS